MGYFRITSSAPTLAWDMVADCYKHGISLHIAAMRRNEDNDYRRRETVKKETQ